MVFRQSYDVFNQISQQLVNNLSLLSQQIQANLRQFAVFKIECDLN